MFAKRVNIVSHSPCRTSVIFKYFCPPHWFLDREKIFINIHWFLHRACDSTTINKSYMNAHVLLNLSKKLGKRDKMQGLLSNLFLFTTSFIYLILFISGSKLVYKFFVEGIMGEYSCENIFFDKWLRGRCRLKKNLLTRHDGRRLITIAHLGELKSSYYTYQNAFQF